MIVVVTLLMYESGIELLPGERTSHCQRCYKVRVRVINAVVTGIMHESDH